MGRNNNKKRKKGNDGKNIIFIAIGVIAVAVVAVFLLMPGKKHLINEEVGEVQRVIDGNTIQLNNGLKVELLGIDKTDKSRNYLQQNLVNKRVRLTADSHEPQYYKDAGTETVRAYVNTDNLNVNGYMLLNKQYAELESNYCSDSLEAFRSYIAPSKPDPDPDYPKNPKKTYELLDGVKLSKKITGSTFLIVGVRDLGTVIGTGFFINENGLALTNYHVLNGNNLRDNFRVFLSDEEGHITGDRDRYIKREVIHDNKLDYTIFYVDLDPGETVPYLDLARERPERGTEVAVVGNPGTDSGLHLATVTFGHISNLPNEGEIQFDASITHGNSGGPVCDYYGRVVGITKSTALDDGRQSAANINFGVDILKVREVLDGLQDIQTYGGK